MDRLELLTVLLKDYEARTFTEAWCDPIDAIEHRMIEQGLRRKDLAVFLGGKNRVTEILARKRSLTIDMIRSLHEGLDIPLSSLVARTKPPPRSSNDAFDADDHFEWNEFPIAEMQKRGWFDELPPGEGQRPEMLVRRFLAEIGEKSVAVPALFRRTFRGPGSANTSRYALIAWTGRLLIRARTLEAHVPKYVPGSLSVAALRELAQLSIREDGPLEAQRYLREHGVFLLIEPALKSTLVDGAALLSGTGRPIVGMTLRFDRIDYFWFTLFHELVHVIEHLTGTSEAFIDRTEESGEQDSVEGEADLMARDLLIPRSQWNASVVAGNPTKEGIVVFANRINVHPAVVAGRVRFETKRYDRFGELLGQGRVRNLFNEPTRGTLP
jgi:HTH-type transcriptional regulator/antitoxin HigA